MADKCIVFRLSSEEKNQISSLSELAIRSDDDKAEKIWGDLHSYIESIINDVAVQCHKDRNSKKKK